VKVQLNETLCNYLRANLSIEREDLFKFFNETNENEKCVFEISEDVAIEVRDWAAEKLQKEGFSEKYELNDEGIKLEQLIDIFYS
jgi:hypothetical protein